MANFQVNLTKNIESKVYNMRGAWLNKNFMEWNNRISKLEIDNDR